MYIILMILMLVKPNDNKLIYDAIIQSVINQDERLHLRLRLKGKSIYYENIKINNNTRIFFLYDIYQHYIIDTIYEADYEIPFEYMEPYRKKYQNLYNDLLGNNNKKYLLNDYYNRDMIFDHKQYNKNLLPHEFWKEINDKLGFTIILYFSNISFNIDNTEALVYFSYAFDTWHAEAFLVYLKKKKNIWKIKNIHYLLGV